MRPLSFFFAVAVVTGLSSQAAPIRVGIFNGVGSNRYWHSSVHTAATSISAMLAAPAAADLGPGLLTASAGIRVDTYGKPVDSMGTPSAAQLTTFLKALDSLDVVVLNNNVDFPSIFKAGAERARLEAFFEAKGVVAYHWTNDIITSDWPYFATFLGTEFQNKPSSDRRATVHLDTAAASDPSWRALNRGLPDTARFVEEWVSFAHSGAQIRARPGLKVSLNVDEASYENGLGGAQAMGDHPLSWYRVQPAGGRFFYTGMGHRAQNFLGTASAATPESARFLRRQLYNAILWTAKVDSTGTVSVRARAAASTGGTLRRTPQGLLLEFEGEGPRVVELFAPDGRRLLRRVSGGPVLLALPGPGVHLLRVSGAGSAVTRRIVAP